MKLQLIEVTPFVNQLFSQKNGGPACAASRWTVATGLLLASNRLNRFWVDADFRDGFFNATQIESVLSSRYQKDGVTIDECQSLVNEVATLLDYDSVKACEKLLEGVIVAMSGFTGYEKNTLRDFSLDLKALLTVSRLLSKQSKAEERLVAELENLLVNA